MSSTKAFALPFFALSLKSISARSEADFEAFSSSSREKTPVLLLRSSNTPIMPSSLLTRGAHNTLSVRKPVTESVSWLKRGSSYAFATLTISFVNTHAPARPIFRSRLMLSPSRPSANLVQRVI